MPTCLAKCSIVVTAVAKLKPAVAKLLHLRAVDATRVEASASISISECLDVYSDAGQTIVVDAIQLPHQAVVAKLIHVHVNSVDDSKVCSRNSATKVADVKLLLHVVANPLLLLPVVVTLLPIAVVVVESFRDEPACSHDSATKVADVKQLQAADVKPLLHLRAVAKLIRVPASSVDD